METTDCSPTEPAVDQLVRDMIASVADKWTMLILEELTQHAVVRFTRLGHLVPGISQKMLTKTLRQLERDGLVERTVHPVIPPNVDYRLTHLGATLSEAFCGVWEWAERYYEDVNRARASFNPVSVAPDYDDWRPPRSH